MRTNGVEAAIARYREAGTKNYAHNRNCAQMGSTYLGVLLYHRSISYLEFIFIINVIGKCMGKLLRFGNCLIFYIIYITSY